VVEATIDGQQAENIRLEIWDFETGKRLRRLENVTLDGLAFAADAKTLVTRGMDAVRKIPAVTGKTQTGVVVMTTPSATKCSLMSADTGKPVSRVAAVEGLVLNGVHAFSLDARLLATGMHYIQPTPPVDALVMAPNSPQSRAYMEKTKAQADRARQLPKIILTDVKTGREAARFSTEEVAALAFSPDGKTLASAVGEPPVVGIQAPGLGLNVNPAPEKSVSIYLWDVATRKVRAQLVGHQAAVTCLAFSPDGYTLASGSADKTVLVWDLSKSDR
jgi:hypothetical protein